MKLLLCLCAILIVGCEARKHGQSTDEHGHANSGNILGNGQFFVAEWFDFEGHRYIRASGGGSAENPWLVFWLSLVGLAGFIAAILTIDDIISNVMRK